MNNEIHKTNPFMDSLLRSGELTKKTLSHNKTLGTMVTSPGQYDLDQVNLAKLILSKTDDMLQDNRLFVKLFVNPSINLSSMNLSALKVFIYIVNNLSVNSDRVIIRVADVMLMYGYNTTPPVYNGIRELIKMKIIAKTYATNEYYINPLLIFNGFVNSCVVYHIVNKYKVPNDEMSIKRFIYSVISGGDGVTNVNDGVIKPNNNFDDIEK